MRKTTVFILFFISLASCEDVNERDKALIEELIQNQVQTRIITYKTLSYNRCLEGIYTEASEIADSLLLLQARLSRDTSDRPGKPIKPEKPEIIELKDSTPIQPFLQDSL